MFNFLNWENNALREIGQNIRQIRYQNKKNGLFYRMSRRNPNNKVDVVLGAQWGDEGKGKLVDMLSDRGLKLFCSDFIHPMCFFKAFFNTVPFFNRNFKK